MRRTVDWNKVDPLRGRMDLEVLILTSKSHRSVAKLIQGAEDFTIEEMLALGELNFRCWLQGYEPVAVLLVGHPVRMHGVIRNVLDEALAEKIFASAQND